MVEDCQKLQVKITKKVKGEYVVCAVKTVGRTATAPTNYKAIMEEVRMPEDVNQKVLEISIREDRDKLQQIKHFYLELCNNSGQRLKGDDTRAKVMI